MNDDFDEIDRALFAMPLQEPPPGMREAILRATVGATVNMPLVRTLPLGTWEIAGVGVALALAVWFVLALIGNPTLAAGLTSNAIEAGRALVEPMTLLWFAAGGAVVAWITVGSAIAESRLLRGRS